MEISIWKIPSAPAKIFIKMHSFSLYAFVFINFSFEFFDFLFFSKARKHRFIVLLYFTSFTVLSIISAMDQQHNIPTTPRVNVFSKSLFRDRVRPLDSANNAQKHSATTSTGDSTTLEMDPNSSSDLPSRSCSVSSSADDISLGKRPNGLSYAEILINFLKGMIGPGCLSLPLAFKQAGLWTGLALVFGLGFLNLLCMHKLVKCSQRLSKKNGSSFLNYGNVAYGTFAHSFSPLRRYNRVAKLVVNASIISLQMGICSVFYVFCAEHIKEFFDRETDSLHFRKSAWMLLIFGPMVLINFVRSLRPIAVLSSIGNIVCIVALAFIFQHLLRADHLPLSSLPPIKNFDCIMTACGAVLYSFEGQAMVLPLENRLRKPSQMVGPFGILPVGIGTVSVVYAASGFLGYITYGDSVRASITQNLPQEQLQFVIVSVLFVLVMYIGFVIQMYVIVDMLWPELSKILNDKWPKVAERANRMICIELIFRTLLVGIAMSIALSVPDLDNIIPLVGATTGMLLALVFPSLLDLLLFLPVQLRRGRKFRSLWLIIEDLALIGVGIFGLLAGIQANLAKIAGASHCE